MPSPTCTINGAATPADVTAGSTVNGALVSTAGAEFWTVTCVSTDEQNTAAAVNASLTLSQSAKTFSFTAPYAFGSALIFQSIVGVKGLGLDADGFENAGYTTTFKVNVPMPSGQRVITPTETTEQNSIAGWTAPLNGALRSLNIVNAHSFGAAGNGVIVTDGAMTSGLHTLTCATSAPFTPGMVGLPITVVDATNVKCQNGTGTQDGTYEQLVTTIAAYVSSSVVTLAAAASQSISATRVTFGTDDTTALTAWLTYLQTNGGRGYLPTGVYCFSANIGITHGRNIEIFGDGWAKSILADLRSHNLAAPALTFAGILSFIGCFNVYLHDFGVNGAFPGVLNLVSSVGTDNFCRGALYAASDAFAGNPGAQNFLAERVWTQYGEDGGISVQSSSYGHWYDNAGIRYCRNDQCPSNAYVVNAGGAGNTSFVNYNLVYTTQGSIVQTGGINFQCIGNMGYGNGANSGASLYVIDGSSIGDVLDNGATGYNISASVGTIAVLASSYPGTSRLNISRNRIYDCTTNWDSVTGAGTGGGIEVLDFGGVMTISDNQLVNCGRTSPTTGGRGIHILGQLSTTGGEIHIRDNVISNTTGQNVTIGINVAKSALMAVTIGKNSYNANVTTPIQLGVTNSGSGGAATSIDRQNLVQTIASTGTTAVAQWADTVIVTANGSVTATLPSAPLVGAAKRIFVKNASTQAGTTTLGTTGGQTIDGASTLAITTGAYHFATVESDGSNWMSAGTG